MSLDTVHNHTVDEADEIIKKIREKKIIQYRVKPPETLPDACKRHVFSPTRPSGEDFGRNFFPSLSSVLGLGERLPSFLMTLCSYFLITEPDNGTPPFFFLASPQITQTLQICIGSTIRIGRKSWCLPYAGFFHSSKKLLLQTRLNLQVI